ncbi:MAG: hypothetical protein KGY81_07285 [Phycisphaerae bacterium]|jgi:hypothetical protein|nr:hypothetical protein [Phycisphaerae bacterium]
MAEMTDQIEIENNHVLLQIHGITAVASKTEMLNRTVVMVSPEFRQPPLASIRTFNWCVTSYAPYSLFSKP